MARSVFFQAESVDFKGKPGLAIVKYLRDTDGSLERATGGLWVWLDNERRRAACIVLRGQAPRSRRACAQGAQGARSASPKSCPAGCSARCYSGGYCWNSSSHPHGRGLKLA